jgi:hypothetical protein
MRPPFLFYLGLHSLIGCDSCALKSIMPGSLPSDNTALPSREKSEAESLTKSGFQEYRLNRRAPGMEGENRPVRKAHKE